MLKTYVDFKGGWVSLQKINYLRLTIYRKPHLAWKDPQEENGRVFGVYMLSLFIQHLFVTVVGDQVARWRWISN